MEDNARLGKGKVNTELIRVDKDIHKILKILAAEKETTMRQLVRNIVEFYVKMGEK